MSPQHHKSKLPSSKDIEVVLLKDGSLLKKCSPGSHQSYIKKIPRQLMRVVVVQLNRKEIPRDTLSSISRQAGWTKKYFELLL